MKRFIIYSLPFIFLVLFSLLNYSCTHSQNNTTKSTGNIAIFETSLGTFEIKLFPDKAPLTVARIKELILKQLEYEKNKLTKRINNA